MRLAKDGVPVVIHDATLRRTGLTSGEVARMTSTQLAKVNVGSWFNRTHPALARDEFEKQLIPSLAEVFELLLDRPGVVYVELKSDGAGSVRDLAHSVTAAIVKFGFQRRAVVVSFDLAAIAETKSLNSSIRTGALFSPRPRPALTWHAGTMLKATADSGADEILVHSLLARTKLVEKAKDRTLPVVVWTVDDAQWLARARALGIHAVITNNPAKLLNV